MTLKTDLRVGSNIGLVRQREERKGRVLSGTVGGVHLEY